MSPAKRSLEKQLTNARVTLTLEDQPHAADCNIFVESYGPPARWRGRLWAIAPPVALKKGAKATLTLARGSSAEVTIQKVAVRGAYEFVGEGLPPAF